MAGDTPEVGDKVSWNWGGGAPGGVVAEKKNQGEIAITSKKGNKIKKNASPDNPAIHVKRSGNDVVKKASELNIVSKTGGKSKGKEDKEEKEDSKKRKTDDDTEDKDGKDNSLEKNDQGVDVRKGGKTATKASGAAKKQKTTVSEEKVDPKKDTKKTTKEEPKANGETKSKPAPKKTDTAAAPKKQKKEPATRKDGDMVSTRTRSQGKK